MKKDYSILIGGPAGRGSALTSHFIGKIFSDFGYYVFNYRDYPSLISGGHNFNILRISDNPVYSHKDEYDLILAMDQNTIDIHQKKLKEKGFIIGNENLKGRKLLSIETAPILKELQASSIVENDIFVGYLFGYLGWPLQIILKIAEKVFNKKVDLIKRALREGYQLAGKRENWENKGKEKYFISGSEAVGVGALFAGIDFYIAYPMTPATPVLHWLAKRQKKYNILVLQLENEIAVVNAALGASFAGAKTMVGTSGGGFALMSEAMSLQGMSEIPLVVYLAQRTSPSTGIPTYTTQGDLKLALNAGQGEFPRIVVAPGDPQEVILRTNESFYLSSKYRMLNIILSDKHLAESNFTFDELQKPSLPRSRFILENPPFDYKSYAFTKNGISPRAVPGQGPLVRATSYEHNEEGYTIEDAERAVKMNKKRFKKWEFVKREVKKLNPVSIYGKGRNLIIGWGSTKGAIMDALPYLNDFRFLQISYISPFPEEEVRREIQKSKKVILVENNVTGLLGEVIREKTGYLIKEKILKYDGRPFIASDIVSKLK